jgi:FAD/FMN-containing dehydrogenase
MKLAYSEGWSTLPAGAMSWLPQTAERDINLIVSTRRLNRILVHEPADLVAITETGVTLKDFNSHLSANRQWLPIDPPDDGRATIGGVIATGLAGAQQIGYGPPRRHVIGMKVVMADGSLVKAGARVVKNVAGYDLCKLITGSYGTLGIIVEANFKLRPLPFVTRTVLVAGQPDELLSSALRIIKAPLFPVAVELVSANLFPQEIDTLNGAHPVLMIRFAGSESAVAAQISSACELLKAESGATRVIQDDEPLWVAMQELPLRFSDRFIWRVGLRPTEAASFLLELIKQSSSGTMWHSGVGDGRVRVVDEAESQANDVYARVDRLRTMVAGLNGTIIIESTKAGAATPQFNNHAASIMARIKEQLDSHKVFASKLVA